MSHVICICHMTKRPDDHQLVSGSVGRLTDTYDMGHWTSQHLTAETSALNLDSRLRAVKSRRYSAAERDTHDEKG